MNDITTIQLAAVTGGAAAKHVTPPKPVAPAPSRNPATDCALGAIGAGIWGASPIAGCIAGAAGGGGNGVLDALLSM